MQTKQLYKDRYPGLVPFDKGQSTIFFGRDLEKKELFYQICLEKMVVLFGKSGLGKSSLLNAGVSPQLERNGYLPLRIRFSSSVQAGDDDKSENLLIRDFILAIKAYKYKRSILYNKEDPKLWEYIKACDFNDLVDNSSFPELWDLMMKNKEESGAQSDKPKKISITPVFIFDQFEEFFLHPVNHQQEFLSQLAEVVHDETPFRILQWLTNINPEERKPEQIAWHQQPVVKIVFSLRSDKLSKMQSIVPYIPTVLRNRYELQSLTPQQAAQAIKGPAVKADLGREYTPAFTFEDATLDEIVKQLSKGSNEIESSQLQIVCNFIEQKVRKELKNSAEINNVVVNNSIIDPEKDFPLILENFYDTQLELIEDPKEREMARRLIEDDLVLDGQRDNISRKKMNKYHGIGDELITVILNTRLVREEITSRGSIFELSHDTLIAPVEKSKNKRLEEQLEKDREEEKKKLEVIAKTKDEELKKQMEQLALETSLRVEAQKQKQEVERQKQRVKTRGMWLFIVTFLLFLTFIIINRNKRNIDREAAENDRDTALKNFKESEKKLDTARKSLIVNNLETIKIKDSIRRYAPEKDKDSITLSLLKNIKVVDSIADYTNNKDSAKLNVLVDTLFRHYFKKNKAVATRLSRKKKIDALNELLRKNQPGANKY